MIFQSLSWASAPDDALLAGGLFSAPPQISEQKIQFQLPEGSALPKTLQTSLQQLELVGTLPPAPGTPFPFVLVAGKPCKDCENHKGLYLVRVDGKKSAEFVFPGKIRELDTHATVFESRAFWGQCLPTGGYQYLSFQREKVDRRHGLRQSVFTATPGKNFIDEKLNESRGPSLQAVLNQVKKKKCFEITGVERTQMHAKINLRPAKSAPEEEEEDQVKENETEKEIPSTAVESGT
jgi:hypothetical protein